MPEVSVTVELKIKLGQDIDPVELERQIAEQGRVAARELFLETCGAIEAEALRTTRVNKQRREKRWVATTFGRLRLERYAVVDRDGRRRHLLDEVLGLGRAEPSPCLAETSCFITVRTTYRESAEILSRVTGEEMSHQQGWRSVQSKGAAIRAEEAVREEMVTQGVLPDDAATVTPPFVVLQADGTFLRAQRESQPRFEVRTAVSFTGKDASGGRKHRRYSLKDKTCYATTRGGTAFSKALTIRAIIDHRLHACRNILACHDGLDDFGRMFATYFPNAVRQADHFHVAERIWQAVGGDRKRFNHLRKVAFADPRRTAKRLRKGHYRMEVTVAEELASYLELVADDLWGIRKIPEHLRRGKMFVVSSQAVEKHQDLLVGRRMKRRGMRWTRKGADNLLALQALRHCDRWPSSWGVVTA